MGHCVVVALLSQRTLVMGWSRVVLLHETDRVNPVLRSVIQVSSRDAYSQEDPTGDLHCLVQGV